jgi:acetyltransferase-like isoleucine patch superfamily enzyme
VPRYFSSNVELGDDCVIDEGVILGYPPARAPEGRVVTRIGSRARIRSGTVIYAGAQIGDDFEAGHNVVIREQVVIGDRCAVWSNSVIEVGARLQNRVKVHVNSVIAHFSLLEDDVFVAAGVQSGNDPLPVCRGCSKGPTIRRGARIGTNATLLPFIVIGEYAMVGAGCVVHKDVPARKVVVGNPARVIKDVDDLRCPEGKPGCEGEAFFRASKP